MPEGDTVLLAARTLDHALARRRVRRSEFRVPRCAAADLAGQEIVEVKARGKHLLFRTSGGYTLQTHFLMDGRWVLYSPGARWNRGPGHAIRVVLETDEWVAVGYDLGIVELFPTVEEGRRLEGLGPDVLGPDWDLEEAVARLMRRPERAVGEALLDQTCLAGIGNIYKNEALFLERLHPRAPLGAVRDVAGLVERARALMRASVERGRQCTTGLPGDPFFVYERAGKPCRRCRTAIVRGRTEAGRRILENEAARSARMSWWCPRCQVEPPIR
jgi:endonuclease-8